MHRIVLGRMWRGKGAWMEEVQNLGVKRGNKEMLNEQEKSIQGKIRDGRNRKEIMSREERSRVGNSREVRERGGEVVKRGIEKG